MANAHPEYGAAIGGYRIDRLRLILPSALLVVLLGLGLNFTLVESDPLRGPFLTTLIVAGAALALGWRALHYWNRQIVLFERGFSFREGAETVSFDYAEIASIRQQGEQLAYFGGLIRHRRFRFTLTTIRGEIIELTNLYERVDQLVEQIEQRVYPRLGGQIMAAFAREERVPFSDSLSLSRDGLHHRGKALAWEDLAGYAVQNGNLVLRASDGTDWLSLPLAEIDNLPLLVDLLRRRSDSRPLNRPS
ncbi:MAG: hypothetical protein JNM70_03550 [Anaerolineae bacterium]|nr:hypothetical protein [Anaerolineae bacterium]